MSFFQYHNIPIYDTLYLNKNLFFVGIGKLSELRVLEVTNNKLTSIPVELSCCENIVTLNLDNNRLTFLPRQLRKLVNLSELSAVGNNLYVLPQGR